jgi:site-specific recombinase XerD
VKGEANRSIYERKDASGRTVYEVGFRTASGSQSFKTVGFKITEARAERDRILGTGVKIANVRLTFGKAADAWLGQQVVNLAPRTRDYYRERLAHIRPVWGRRRLDQITTADASRLVADLRAKGFSESTINGALITAGRVYRFAKGEMNWRGDNPIELMDRSNRARLAETPPRRIFTPAELDATIAAATGTWRTIFVLTATTGARQSEIAALVWDDLDIADVDEASVRFEFQLDRKTGERVRLKTPESRRTIELPRFVAVMLAEHKASSRFSKPAHFVFATRTGKAISQRNLARELRVAQTAATDSKGRPTFPLLHVKDEDGEVVKPPRNSIPSWHSLRHSAASEAIHAGDSVEEVSWRLGHKNSITTARIYTHELKSAKRSAERRAKLDSRYGNRWQQVAAADLSRDQSASTGTEAEVVDCRQSAVGVSRPQSPAPNL